MSSALQARGRTSRSLGREDRPLRELAVLRDHVRERHPFEHLPDRDLDVAPQLLQAALRVGEARVVLGGQAAHRVQRPLERVDDVRHVDVLGGARQTASAAGAAEALHQSGLVQGAELLLEEPERHALGFGDGRARDQRRRRRGRGASRARSSPACRIRPSGRPSASAPTPGHTVGRLPRTSTQRAVCCAA